MIAVRDFPKMTPDEYLAWEAKQELRYEYCHGEVFAMAGGTKNHDEIAFNLRRSLADCVEDKDCRMSGSDVKVKLPEGSKYRYPDLTVSCDIRDQGESDFYQFPKLIVEVLSPSTEVVDRNKKFQECIEIHTLEEYILISSESRQVECSRRGEGRMWLYYPYKAGETVRIESLNTKVTTEQLYRNIRFPSAEEDE